jgi:hypothetical protein
VTTRHELGLMMAALYSAFGREVTEVDVDAWHLVLGDVPRAELSQAVLVLARSAESFPSASAVRLLVWDRRRSSGQLRDGGTKQSQYIGMAVREWRLRNPGATSDEVSEYVSRLERRLTTHDRS